MVDEGAYHLKGKPELSASRRKKLPVPTGVSRILIAEEHSRTHDPLLVISGISRKKVSELVQPRSATLFRRLPS